MGREVVTGRWTVNKTNRLGCRIAKQRRDKRKEVCRRKRGDNTEASGAYVFRGGRI